MCSSSNSTGTSSSSQSMWPYTLKVPNPLLPLGLHSLDIQQRAQLYDYNQRLQYAMRTYPNLHALGAYAGNADPLRQLYMYRHDPRTSFIQEEPKPSQSYIGLIAMAILSSAEVKMVLSDIYQWILDHYSYFRSRGPGWRNSIRHNLSLNDCFIKSGRSANGKGHFWAIHPANMDDFKKGDFRRRRAQRRVRKYLGLSVPDDEDSPCPSPVMSQTGTTWDEPEHHNSTPQYGIPEVSADTTAESPPTKVATKRRLFDVESLLAPDTKVSRLSPVISPVSKLSEYERLGRDEPSTSAISDVEKDESEITSTDDVINKRLHETDVNYHKSPPTSLQIPNLSLFNFQRPSLPLPTDRVTQYPTSLLQHPLYMPTSQHSIFSRAAFGTAPPYDAFMSAQKWQEALTRIMNKSLERTSAAPDL